MGTKIEWTNDVWNPIIGCSHCSPGCDRCYAERMANRQATMVLAKGSSVDTKRGQGRYVAVIGPHGKWNGLTAIDETYSNIKGEINKPVRMKKPRRIFVCSMGDLFHEYNPDKWIETVIQVQRDAPQHTYLWLTKRAIGMRDFILDYFGKSGPGKNVWCGVTVCNQEEANRKISILLEIPAAVKFVSIEPMLSRVDLSCALKQGLDWVIVGGESGPGARPMQPDWVRMVRLQCAAAGVPFLFKQWGGVNKKSTGRFLDGKIHDEYPKSE